tara:strand:+ start:392 stop:790 length:399 start_codon:yes stop_codon:yes gene_type:complete
MKEFFKNLGGALLMLAILFIMYIPPVYFVGVCIHFVKSQNDGYFNVNFSNVSEFYMDVFKKWYSWVFGVFGGVMLSNLPKDMFAVIYLVFIIFLFITAIPRYFVKKNNESLKKYAKNKYNYTSSKERLGGVK